jgi:hypothetical protein
VKQNDIFIAILNERDRQDAIHPNDRELQLLASSGKWSSVDKKTELERLLKDFREQGWEDWYTVLAEEVMEVFTADTLAEARKELIQVAAVAVKMIEFIDKGLLSEGSK